MREDFISFENDIINDSSEEKYLNNIEFDENMVSKLNRRNNQQADRNRMVVDSAGLKDTYRIRQNRYTKKYGKE